MSRKKVTRYDSLEVLLDTMCNIFGGLIMTAVLVTLLCRQMRLEEVSETRVKDDIARLQQDLDVAAKFQQDLKKEDPEGNLTRQVEQGKRMESLAQQSRTLDQRQQQVRKQVDELRKATLEGQAGQTDALQARLDESRRNHEDEQKKRDRLRDEKGNLESQIEGFKGESSRKVRFPKEQQSTKKPFHVIVQGGHLYPLMLMRNGQEVRNEATIDWSQTFLGETCQAKEGVPTADVEAALRESLSQIPGGQRYILFWVSEDSFEAFNRIKEETVGKDLEYGWRPVRGNVILAARAGGTTPPPL